MRADPGQAPPSQALSARLVDETQLAALSAQWAERVAAEPSATVFSGPLFQMAMRRTLSPGSGAVVLSENGNLAAVLPVCEWSLGRSPFLLREAGFAHNSHSLRNNLLMAPDAGTATVLLRFWQQHMHSDTLLLENLPETGGLPQTVFQAARGLGLGVDVPTPGRVLLFAEPGHSYQDFIATRSGQFRRQIRKRLRELQDAGRFRIGWVEAADLAAAIPAWRGVVERGWQGTEAGGEVARTEADWALHAALADNGRLWLIWLDGRPVAALRMLEDARAVYVHTMHYDKALRAFAPGLVLFDAMIQDACARGLPRVDFNGNSAFFARWSTGSVPHVSIRIYRRSIRGRAAQATRYLRRRFRPGLAETVRLG